MKRNNDEGSPSLLREVFGLVAVGVGVAGTVAAVATGAGLPAYAIAAGLSAAYLLKK